jgi:archaetidylinositol phosphate synthase
MSQDAAALRIRCQEGNSVVNRTQSTSAVSPGTHRREHQSVLAGVEKRALVWLAVRMPARINSDHLSALGLVSMAAAGASFALFPLSPLAGIAVCFWLAANWFGDSLDGTLARVRGHQRPRYGYYVDHVIDLAGATCLLGGLAASGLMSPIVAMAVLVGYLLVCAEAYLATHAAGVFRMSFLGLGPTELRIVLAAGVVRAMDSPLVSIDQLGTLKLFDVGGVAAFIGLGVVFVVAALRNVRALYAAEPLPAGPGRVAA